jgi:hypothetical protein
MSRMVYSRAEMIVCPYCQGIEHATVYVNHYCHSVQRVHRCSGCHHVIWSESWRPVPWWGVALTEGTLLA